MKTSFVDLMKLGKEYSCTFAHTDTKGNETNGTVYISGKNMRGDFTMMMNGKETQSHMIRKDDTNYMWTSAMPQGMMMKITAEDASVFGNADTQKNMGMSDTDPIDFSCDDWSVDESQFEPPEDVKFTDMSAQMESMKKMMEGNKNMMKKNCSVCDAVTDANAKAQCKAALGC